MLENLISLQDVLKSLKISRSSLYRLISEGLPHVKIGGLKFDPVAVENWILEHKSSGRVNTSKPVETLKNSPAIRPASKPKLTKEPESKLQARGNEFKLAIYDHAEKITGRWNLFFKCDDGSIAKPVANENTPAKEYYLSNPTPGDRVKLQGWLKQGRFVVTEITPL